MTVLFFKLCRCELCLNAYCKVCALDLRISMNDCSSETCMINDKSKEREKRKVVCASPGCLKEFHTLCIGRPKVSDKELNNMFFVCTRCETYLSYSADIARKTIMMEIDLKIDELKKSLHHKFDTKINLECSKISAQTNALIDSFTHRFEGRLEDLRSQATEANDLVRGLILEKDTKVNEMQDEISSLKSHCLGEINQAKVSFKSIANQVALLDSQKRKKTFLIKKFPRKYM